MTMDANANVVADMFKSLLPSLSKSTWEYLHGFFKEQKQTDAFISDFCHFVNCLGHFAK